MAIQDSFNLNNAINSQAYAYKCWYNYNYGGNTMKISSSDMGEITQTWSGELSNWQATALDDENAYEIEDDDFSTAKANGKEQAKDKTGGDKSNQTGTCIRTAITGVSSLARAAGTVVASVSKKYSIAWEIAAPTAFAVAGLYYIKKPNKEQKEACDALQNEMTNAQGALSSAQSDMETYDSEITELSDEAAVYNEDTNETIEENKSEFDIYKASYDALMEKVEAGETLTEDEQALLQELVPIMQELGVNIQETSEETTDIVSEIYDEMGTYQEGFDNAASTMGEVEGLTDYAESFDETTRTLCYVEGASQALNGIAGAAAGGKAAIAAAGSLGFNVYAWACAAMGVSAGVMSGFASKEQFEWAGDVGTEIDMRKATQDFNVDTSGIYDERVDSYEGYMGTVEDLTLEIPETTEEIQEDMEMPEEDAPVVPETPRKDEDTPTTGGGLGITPKPEDEDKDKPVK